MADKGDNKKVARQVAKYQKEQTESLKSYVAAQKELESILDRIVDQQKEVAKAQKIINDLGNDATNDDRERLQLAKESLQVLQGQVRELRDLRNGLRAAGNTIKKNILPYGKQVLTNFYDMDQTVRDVSMSLGLSSSAMGVFRSNVTAAAVQTGMLGISATDLAQAQGAYAEETGRVLALSSDVMVQMSQLGRATGLGLNNIAQMAGQMEAFGMGSLTATETIEEIADLTNTMGVNTGKVLKKFQENLNLVNKLNFKGGVIGLGRMAAYSEKFKINMASIAESARGVFNPEAAIEASAALQVLGGGFAQLGDPFKLMYEARNDPEAYAKSLKLATEGMATFNKETGTFTMTAQELQRAEEAAKALNMPMDEMVELAKQGAKIDMAEGMLGNLNKEDRDLLATMGEIGGDGTELLINGKDISKLSAQQQHNLAETLRQEKDNLAERAEQSQSTLSLFKNIGMTLMAALLPLAESLDQMLRDGFVDRFVAYMRTDLIPGIQSFVSGMVSWIHWATSFLGPGGTLAAVLSLYLGFKAVQWIMRGRALGIGFNMTVNKGSWMKRLVGFFSKKKGTDALSSQTPTTNKPVDPSQTTKGMKVGDMIKGAAAILILSAALFVFAKAMQELQGIPLETYVGAAAGLTMLAITAKVMGKGSLDMIMGAAAIVILAAALVPFAFAMQLMSTATNGFSSFILLTAGLAMLAITAGLMGAASIPIILGALAIGILSLALIPLGYAIKLVSEGLAIVVDSFTNMFSVINSDNVGSILLLGPALMGASLGIFSLAASLVALGIAYLAGGWLGLLALGQTADEISTAFGDVDASAISQSINAINAVDMGKIEALKELSGMMALWGMFGGSAIKVEVGDLHVDGTIDIEGQAGGKSSTDWVKDPIFRRELKSIIMEQLASDKKGNR